MGLPAAGWYPDPADDSRIRWWDGAAWAVWTQPVPHTGPDATIPGLAVSTGPVFSVDTSEVRTHTAWAVGNRGGFRRARTA